MKKLIALIGAVATAFGLYAETADYYGNSFETAQEGVSGETWELPTLWSTTLQDAFKVGAYVGDELTGIYKTGAQRRDGSDEQSPKLPTTNDKFLKLETGTNVLDRALTDLDTTGDKFYFDQLVKFTGFEEEPAFAADTKIAVWMSAIETEDYVPAVYDEGGELVSEGSGTLGSTNLYVQVGNGTAAQKVQLKGTFAVDKWYRITIKSIGDVVADAGVAVEHQLGFLVFINGEQAEIVDADKNYYKYATAFEGKPTAKYYAAGQLFTAMTADTTLAKVGYQGIGAIDDVVLSASSPDFDTFVDVEIKDITLNGTRVIKVGDEVITDQTSIKVKPGNILVDYEAHGPYIVRNGEGVTWKWEGGAFVIDEDAEIKVLKAAAVLNDTDYKAADELYGLLVTTGLANGDSLEFLEQATIKESELAELPAYEFSEGTTIDVTIENDVTTWMVESMATGDLITDNVGAEAGFAKYYTLADETSIVSLAGEVAGLVQADYLTVGDTGVTVSGEGKVITLYGTLEIWGDDELITPKFDEATGYYTYQIISTVTFTLKAPENASITEVKDSEGNVVEADELGNYVAEPDVELTVTLTANNGYLFADGSTETTEKITVAEGEITLKTAPDKAGFAIIIAESNIKYFPTLQGAIDAAGTDDLPSVVTIMEADLGDDTIVEITKAVTIDLGGQTLAQRFYAHNGGDLVVSNGTLTSAGKYTMRADYVASITLADGVDVINTNTTLGGSGARAIDGYDGCTITVGEGCSVSSQNYGIFVWNDGTVGNTTTLTVNGTVTAVNAWAIAGSGNDVQGTDITIGQTAYVESTNDVGLYFPNEGSLAINGGTVKGVSAVYVKAGVTAVIDGANLIATGAAADYAFNGNGTVSTGDALIVDNCGYPAGTPTITVSGGTFESANGAAVGSYSKDSTQYPVITGFISGGKFKGAKATDVALIAATEAQGAKWVEQDGFLVPATFTAIAKIGDVKYESLPAAIAAAGENATITLLADIELTTKADIIVFPATFKGTLDLNGKTIERTAANNYVFDVKGDLTITGEGTVKFEPVKLGYTTSKKAGVTGLGAPSSMVNVNGTLTINGGTFQCDYCCVKADEGSTVLVDGGTLTVLPTDWAGLTFAIMVWGDVTIDSGVMNGNVQVCEYAGNEIEKFGQLEINGGTFDPQKVYLLAYDADYAPVATIANTVADSFTAEYVDYGAGADIEVTKTVGDEYTTFSVAQRQEEPVAKIGDVEYTSLQAAFDAAKAGDTVELIDNLTVTTMATMENKDLIFNLGGFILTSDGAAAVISMTNSVVVITNGIINGISGSDYGIENTGASHITFASDAVITGSSAYMFYPRGAVVDIYGTITQLNNQYVPCIWASVEGCVINIYDGANLSTPGGDIIRHRCNMPEPSDNAAVVNIYGGTFSGGDIIYGYASSGSVNNGKVNIYGGTFTVDKVYKVLASADLTIRPFDGECSTLKFSKLATGLADACAPGYAPVQGDDGYYTIQKVWDVKFYVGDVVSNAQVVVNGEYAQAFDYDNEAIEAWTNAAGVAYTEVAIVENTDFFAQLKATDPWADVEEDDVPGTTPENKAQVAEKLEAIAAALDATGDGKTAAVSTWIKTVYGEAGVSATKLLAATADQIALAVANDLPITANPTFEVETSEVTAANGVAAFEFALKDGDSDPIAIKAITEKVKAMVKYTGDLATTFRAAAENTEVSIAPAGGKIKVELLKQTGVNAGFMKVEPNQPTK